MTTSSSKAQTSSLKSQVFADNTLAVDQAPNESAAQALARAILTTRLRHSLAASGFAASFLPSDSVKPGVMDYVKEHRAAAAPLGEGDLAKISEVLAAQALTLDSMFTELARRAALNMGQHLDASERYARLALKAQSNSRSTLEALARLHQPRETTMRHVHVNDGGQAIVTETLNYQPGATADDER